MNKNETEIMTTIRVNRKKYIETKKKLLEENKTFKEWINEKLEEEVNGKTKGNTDRKN